MAPHNSEARQIHARPISMLEGRKKRPPMQGCSRDEAQALLRQQGGDSGASPLQAGRGTLAESMQMQHLSDVGSMGCLEALKPFC